MKRHREQGGQDREAHAASPRQQEPGRATLVEKLVQVGPAEHAVSVDGGARTAEAAPSVPRPSPSLLPWTAPFQKVVGDSGGVQVGANGPKENGTDGTPTGGTPATGPAPKKKAGVESFTVDWSKHSSAGPTVAKLRLDYNAKFKKDDDHDPALADFRQNAMTKWEITDGPHKGAKGDTSPLHDDNYSRADDLGGHTIHDQLFYSNDNPGWNTWIDKNDVLDYAFTAEQMIIDKSDGNKVIEKRGPHTATITGKDARVYGNVPKKLG
jgi:hypothetical protein